MGGRSKEQARPLRVGINLAIFMIKLLIMIKSSTFMINHFCRQSRFRLIGQFPINLTLSLSENDCKKLSAKSCTIIRVGKIWIIYFSGCHCGLPGWVPVSQAVTAALSHSTEPEPEAWLGGTGAGRGQGHANCPCLF